MSIRMFNCESWVCGWFDRYTGALKDVQQYTNENEARECAEKLRHVYQTFVGRVEDVTNWESVEQCGETEDITPPFISKLGRLRSVGSCGEHEPTKLDKIERYLHMLYSAQQSTHSVHEEIAEGLKMFRKEAGI